MADDSNNSVPTLFGVDPTISLRAVSAALSGLMFFLYSLQGLTPLPIELPPSYLGLLNSAHLRFAIQLGNFLSICNIQKCELFCFFELY